MPSVTVAWSFAQKRSIDVDHLVADLKSRYAPLYAETLEHHELHDEQNGLVCIGPSLDSDLRVVGTPRLLAGMNGSPTLVNDRPGVKRGPVSATSMLDLTRCVNGEYENADGINPPFSLVWIDLERCRIGALADGIAMQQLYSFTDGANTVISSRIWPIVRLMGFRPAINHDAWRHWFVRGWFNGSNTGFSGINTLSPGEAVICSSGKAKTRSFAPVEKWISARESSGDGELLERAVESFSWLIDSHQAGSQESFSDLTGGVDSRAICAAISKGGRDCTFTTSGSALSHDVIIAKKVATRLGLSWKRERRSNDVPDDLSTWPKILGCFRRMVSWSEGAVEPNRFEHFGAAPQTRPVGPHFYGAEAGISKSAMYRHHILRNPEALADAVIAKFMAGVREQASVILNHGCADSVTEAVCADLDTGRDIGLRGFELFDFNFLHSRVRRWGGAHLTASRFDDRVSPFMHIDHIGLGFALSPAAKSRSIYQQAIIMRNRPDLSDIPINQQLYLSKVWRWLPRARRISWVNRRLGGPTGLDQIRLLARPHVEDLIASDSRVFEVVNRETARKRSDAFFAGADSHYYFLLRLISFDVWCSENLSAGSSTA